MAKRILNKHGDAPDLQEEAAKTVVAQAELLRAEWVRNRTVLNFLKKTEHYSMDFPAGGVA